PPEEPGRRRPAGPNVDTPDERDERRRDRGRSSDRELEDGVEAQGIPRPVGTGAEEEAPRAQSTEEDGQDRRRRRGGGTEDQHELPEPHGLVNERAGPGAAEEERDGRSSPVHPFDVSTKGTSGLDP